ncbi:hypothetical protein T439DRAFT_379837 [Meredithblackwellia eburnea MCA 4105]
MSRHEPTASTSGLRIVNLSQTPATPGGDFVHFKATMRLPIAPIWGSKGNQGAEHGAGGMDGVREVLAGWVMRYLPPLRAVLLTFNPIPTFAHPSAQFPLSASPFDDIPLIQQDGSSPAADSDSEDSPSKKKEEESQVKLISLPMITGSGFALPTVAFQGLAWRPRIGQRIVGSPTLSTPSHISLLIHNLFNASIPASQIPSDLYYYDPEYPVPEEIQARQRLPNLFPAEAVAKAEKEAEEEAGEGEEQEVEDEEEESKKEEEDVEREMYSQRGWWRRRGTDEALGGANGRVEFVIVGLTISESMISVTGSLLRDPFEPNTTKAPAPTTLKPSKKRKHASTVEEEFNSGASTSDEDEGNEASDDEEAPAHITAPPRVVTANDQQGAEVDEGEEEDEAKGESEKKVKKDRKKDKQAKKAKK